MDISSTKLDEKQLFVSLLSAVLVSVASTLIMILLFALVIRFFNVKDSWIFPINQVIKCISLLFGVMIILQKVRSDEKDYEYPFAPYLVIGTLVSMFFGTTILNSYMALLMSL